MASADMQQGTIGAAELRRLCFVINPSDQTSAHPKERAEEVLREYIEPACEQTGYWPLPFGPLLGPDQIRGLTNALRCAPLTIAYLGSKPWDSEEMVEIGYRLSTKLPLVYLCDQDAGESEVAIPWFIGRPWVVTLPASGFDRSKVALLRDVIQNAQSGPYLEWIHPIALINVLNQDTQKSQNLLYTAASRDAEEIFGLDKRLVGLTMTEFLKAAKRRMHPAQFRAFIINQRRARLKLRDRMVNVAGAPAVANIPLYFDRHEIPKYNGRAYLPIVFQDYTFDDQNWYNVGVFYLDVTSFCKKTTNSRGEEYYYCLLDLDTTNQKLLEPLKPIAPLKVFISYSRSDRDKVEPVYKAIKEHLFPEAEPWMDLESLYAKPNFTGVLADAMRGTDHFLVFFGPDGPGKGQSWELSQIMRLQISDDLKAPKYPVTPVLMDGVTEIPKEWDGLNANGFVRISEIEQDNEKCLRRVLFSEYPEYDDI